MDVTKLSFNSLLLLERVQLSWFPDWLPEQDLGIALQMNPVVEWFMRHKCPELNAWLDKVMKVHSKKDINPEEARQAEIAVMVTIEDLLVYVLDPAIYDSLKFNQWDSTELTSLVNFTGKTVIDVGAGPGRLTLVAAGQAAAVFAVEPVTNLRGYLKEKARKNGFKNVFCVDGTITDIPFPDGFADVTMGGHVYGDFPEQESKEMLRVTKPGGMVIQMGVSSKESGEFLLSKGFQRASYEEPGVGTMGKYWLIRR